ncbi:MAG: glycosyltransferase family 2 protein [SAR202 cluster bacterium]|nr:glycosyltransferase family 2 protein [SAR202 cluster bacterium]
MPASIEVVIPVLNEEKDLPPSIAKLHGFMEQAFPGRDWRITVMDNGSTDSTPDVATRLSSEFNNVGWVRMEQRGRGRAVKRRWLESKADIVSYMDVDLSTDLNHFPQLVGAIEHDGADIAIGSRLMKGSKVINRPPHREVTARGYSTIFRVTFLTKFHDAQCGFKAISRKAADELLPLVQDTGWFFDTELLIIAEKNRYTIKEVPVKWTDDPDSRVKIIKTAIYDLKGLARLKFGGLKRASRALKAGKGAGATRMAPS